MWIFTRYGMYSAACANGRGGKLNPKRIMIRARSRAHLEALKGRFASLRRARIREQDATDYAYRIIIRKSLWVRIVAALAREQTWSNFKDEAQLYNGAGEYTQALHRVWAEMRRLQPWTEQQTPAEESAAARGSDNQLRWLLENRPDLAASEQCFDCSERIGDAEYELTEDALIRHHDCEEARRAASRG